MLGGHAQNGEGGIDHGLPKPGVSHKWFDELSRLIKQGPILGFRWQSGPEGPSQLLYASSLCNWGSGEVKVL